MVEPTRDEPQFNALLVISEFECAPEYITEILQLDPARCEGLLVHDEGGWALQAPATEEDSVEARMEALSSLIRDHADRFTALPRGARVTVGYGVFNKERESLGYIPNHCLELFARIGAGLQIVP